MRCVLIAIVCLTLTIPVVLAQSRPERQQNDVLVEKGRAIAQQHCARCHVIGDYNRTGGISSTPSFPLLVSALPDWQERFDTFHIRRPHPAIIRFEEIPDDGEDPPNAPIRLKLSDIEAINAFAAYLYAHRDQ